MIEHNGTYFQNCPKCSYGSENAAHLKRHILQVHEKANVVCPICGKVVSRADKLKGHMRLHNTPGPSHPQPHECRVCGKTFPANWRLQKHIRAVHEPDHVVLCRLCDLTFSSKSNYDRHIQTIHNGEKRPNPTPVEPKLPPPPPPAPRRRPARRRERILPPEDSFHPTDDIMAEIPDHVRPEYRKYWSAIRTSYSLRGKLRHDYNFRVPLGLTQTLSEQFLEFIYQNETKQFMVNVSAAIMLQEKPQNDLPNQPPPRCRYFWAQRNRHILDRPMAITCRADLAKFNERLSDVDLLDYAIQHRLVPFAQFIHMIAQNGRADFRGWGDWIVGALSRGFH
jgi:hypothetical protein